MNFVEVVQLCSLCFVCGSLKVINHCLCLIELVEVVQPCSVLLSLLNVVDHWFAFV